jgi:hypothetical protein
VTDPRLARECRVFTRHLTGAEPGDYVISRYLDAHRVRRGFAPASRLDRFLCAFARVSPLAARLADSWAAIIAPTSTLRRKLILLLAMLESCAPHYRRLEDVRGGQAAAFAGLLFRGVLAVLVLLVSLLIFVPARILLGPAGDPA